MRNSTAESCWMTDILLSKIRDWFNTERERERSKEGPNDGDKNILAYLEKKGSLLL